MSKAIDSGAGSVIYMFYRLQYIICHDLQCIAMSIHCQDPVWGDQLRHVQPLHRLHLAHVLFSGEALLVTMIISDKHNMD